MFYSLKQPLFHVLISRNLFLILFSLFFTADVFSAPATVTFQARIVKPNLTNLESSSVSFKFYYLYPKPVGTDLQCVIYAEEITGVNMTGSKGLVTLQLGSGTRTYGSGNLKNVFDNSTPSYPCQAGGTYTPAATDNRRVIVQFNDGTGIQTLPPSDLSAVPYAMQSYNSQRLGNNLATDFLKFTDFTGTCAAGEYLKYDSTASPKFSCATPTGTGAGIVMSVAPGTGPLLVGGTAADPTISIPKASASVDGYLSSADFTTFNSKLSNFSTLTSSDISAKYGYIPASPSDSRFTDTRTPTDGSVTAAKIASATITFDKFNQSSATTGQVIKWDGSAWVASADNTGVGTVTSVAGRTGVVTLSSGDISGLAFGTTAGTYAQGNDSRFSDQRNPINDSVTSAKILDGTIASADISAGAVTFDKLNQASATSGQVIKWNGSAWVASSDDTGVGSVTSVAGRTGVVTLSSGDISGLAFGTTAGTFAQGNDSRFTDQRTPTDNSVTSTKILDGTIASADLSNASIEANKLAQMGATTGQVMKWNGSAWVASSDDTGAGGTVTSVSASGPLSSSGGGSPNITIAKATASVDGYLSSADFTTFAAKLSNFSTLLSSDITSKLGYTPVNPSTLGTAALLNTNQVVLVSNLPANCNAGQTLTFSSPTGSWVCSNIVLNSNTVTSAMISSLDWTKVVNTPTTAAGYGIPKATAAIDGYLSSADFTTFNSKVSKSGDTMTGALNLPSNGLVVGTDQLLVSGGNVQVGSTSAWGGRLSVTSIGSATSAGSATSNAAIGVTDSANNVALSIGYTSFTPYLQSAFSGSGNNLLFNPWGGNVGIGTTSPSYTLDVTGDINVTGTFKVNGSTINSGTVSGVSSANTDIGVANGTTAPVLTLNSGTGNNQILKLNGSAQIPAVNGSLLTSLNATNLASGTVAAARMPALTGDITTSAGAVATTIAANAVTAAKLESATNGQLFIGNGSGFTKATLTGTADQVSVTNGSGTITLSTPQNIATTSSPSFTGLTLSGITGNTLLRANGSGVLANATSADVTGLLGFTPANESSAWSLNASGDVSRLTGNVGIGTASPVTKLDVAGAVRVGTDASACTSTNAGAIRLNSTSSLVETCNGSSWESSQTMNSVPQNTVLLMQTCPSGWADNGAVGAGGASGTCGGPTGTNCRMCQSPASDAIIPAGSNLLFETCPARWTNLGITYGGGSAGLNIRYTSCQSPVGGSGLPTNSRIIAASCPANWNDIGSVSPGQISVTCSGVACRVCEVGSGSVKVSQLLGMPATTTTNGGDVGMYAANGGSTSGMGGSVTLRAGSATTEGAGGAVGISAGSPMTATSTSYSGSGVSISASSGLGTLNGGSVSISAGWAGSSAAAGSAGNISLIPGQDNAFGYGGVSIGSLTPTAALHIRAGVANASGAPLKFTSGPVLTTPEPGAIEYDGTNLYYTDSGATRRTLSTATMGSTLAAGDGLVSTPSLSFTSDPDTGFYSSGANSISLATGGTERIRVNASGNVGIGGISPATKLDVAGDATIRGPSWSSSGDKARLNIGNGGLDYIEAELNGPMKIMSAQPITFGHDLNGGEQIRISHLGYLGIGTNNPSVKLHTLSNAEAVRTEATTGTSHVFSSFRNGTGRLTVGLEGSTPGTMVTGDTAYAGIISASSGSSLVLATGDTARMTIVGTGLTMGNIGIGLTAPTAKMAIASSDGTASTAPLKLTAGTNLSTPEAGAIEFDGTSLFYTDSGATRRTIATTTSAWSAITTNTTVAVGAKVLVDTSGGVVTITLPASPVLGDEVHIIDAAGSFATNNLTVARNGNRIMGLTEDMTVSTNNSSFTLVYYNATNGWRLK